MDSSLILYSLALSLLVSLLIRVLYWSPNACKLDEKKTPPLPPSPPSLPIVGHLHHFKKPLHRSLARLSSLHSSPALPLLLRFASRPVVVVSSLPLAEECFTKNDLAFASRPQLPSSKSITYNHSSLGSAPYGDHWRNTRRIATVELLSTARLNSLTDLRSDEVRTLIRNLFTESNNSDINDQFEFREVELKPRLFGVAFNVMMRMIAGKRGSGREDEERFRGVVEEALAMLGASNLSDFFPLLRVVDFGGVKKRMKRVEVKMDTMLQSLIDEKRIKRKEEGEDIKNNKKKDMLEVLMALQEEAPEYYTDEKIKAMIVTLFFAGTDTSTVTVEWAMTLLLNHPDSLRKARDEIDSLVAADAHLLEEQDLSSLPYLQAIINETLRLCPAAPLLLPHEAIQECTVGGCHVPHGTMLLVNAWAIQRDPALWPDPLEFRPERFIEGVGAGKNNIIPFGMGRRRCPGDGLAMRAVGLVLGTMIQCFEWERIGREPVDLEETGGLTMRKLHPLRAMYKARQAMVDVLSHI